MDRIVTTRVYPTVQHVVAVRRVQRAKTGFIEDGIMICQEHHIFLIVILNVKSIVKGALHMLAVKNGRQVSMGQCVILGADIAVKMS